MDTRETLNIDLGHIEEGLQLVLDAREDNTLFDTLDAEANGEAQHQLTEGFSYDYEFNNDEFCFPKDQIVQPHPRKKHLGTISPNIYVGTLTLSVLKGEQEAGSISLEVRSVKASYRDDYRDMLELITEKCTDLLMLPDSPVAHNFEVDFEKSNETLYQKFAFIKSIISTDEFSESVHRIVSAPVTQWKEKAVQKDIRNIRRFKNSNIKQLITGSNRNALPEQHFLQSYGLSSVPEKITSVRKTDTVDTPENRFVKFALESFLRFGSEINRASKPNSRLWQESDLMEKELESFLHHSVFKEISRPETLKLNSPILQRKEGYREVLRVWLMFDLAAKLVWKGGDDIYSGGKKDIATLYEYWLFFKLLDLLKSIFNIEPKDTSELIKKTADGLGLQLKQGKHTALRGVYDTGTRKLNVRFNYNRSFSPNDYPKSGSWTTTMRPDYTLSFWPSGISEQEAEIQELIVHVHFDAKYKIANLSHLLEAKSDENLSSEKTDGRKGIYKNADLLKMHAYKDAIRRTGGAYVLYPGEKSVNKKGFHEVIPGLGAFPVRPSKTEDGISELKSFILDVVNHFLNRTSQRERIAFREYDIYRNKPEEGNELNELLPETYGENRSLIPDDTFVLVGFYKAENLDWIRTKGLYNAWEACGENCETFKLGSREAGAKFLLLHSPDDTENILLKITTEPQIFSKQKLDAEGYPSNLSQSYNLVYQVEEVTEKELVDLKWDITLLDKYESCRNSALPFAVSLAELMRVKINK